MSVCSSSMSRSEAWIIFSDSTGTQELDTDGEGSIMCPRCAKPLVARVEVISGQCDVVIHSGWVFGTDGGRLLERNVVSLDCTVCEWQALAPSIIAKGLARK